MKLRCCTTSPMGEGGREVLDCPRTCERKRRSGQDGEEREKDDRKGDKEVPSGNHHG